MRNHYSSLLILLAFMLVNFSVSATEEDKPAKAKTAITNTPTGTEDLPTQAESSEQKQLYKKASLEAQLELDKAMRGYGVSTNSQNIQKDYMMDVTARTNAVIADSRSQAKGVFDYLDSKGLYKEGNLQYEDLMTLPIGLKKQFGTNGSAEVGILKAAFYSDYAEMTVFVRLKMNVPGTGDAGSPTQREVFFGADKIKFTKAGGVQAFNAVLLGDFIIPMGKWTLKLKGGLDIATGNINYTESTYCKIVCGQFEEGQLAAEIIFPRDVLVPLSPTTYELSTNTTERVTGKFNALFNNGLNDLIVKADFDKPFAISSFPKFGFSLRNAIVDLSDVKNDLAVVFPSGYVNPDKIGAIDTYWKGLYVERFDLILPKEFKDKTAAAGRKIVAIDKFIFDKSGVSGSFGIAGTAASPVIAIENGDASKWAFALYDFNITLKQNKLTAGYFSGAIKIPLDPDTQFGYSGKFLENGDFDINAIANTTYNLKFKSWRATATVINPELTMKSVNGEFKPSINMNGKLTIGTDVSGRSNLSEETGDEAAVKFKNIIFQNLKLETDAPFISMDKVTVKSSHSLAYFPVSLDAIGVTANGTQAALYFDVSVSLMADKMSGTVGGQFNMNYITEGGARWELESFQMKKLEVHGDLTSVKIDGFAEIYESAQKKGFKGELGVQIKGGTLDIKGAICAEFGFQKTENYHYWNVQLATQFSPSLPLAGPFAVNGASLGVYHHMKAKYSTGGRASICTLGSESVEYIEDKTIALGLKGVIGLEAGGKAAFNGFAGLEFIFGEKSGLQYVSLFGEGTIAGGFKLPGAVNYMSQQYGKVVKNVTDLSLAARDATIGKEKMTENLLKEKAEKQYGDVDSGKKEKDGGTVNGAIYAKVAFVLDIDKGFFKANADVTVDAGTGIITGKGNLEVFVGKHHDSPFHTSGATPSEWWVYVGHADKGKRVELQANLGFASAKAEGYFMLGYHIPDLPCPTGFVYETFKDKITCDSKGYYKRACDTKDKQDFESTGTGIALGMNAEVEVGFNFGIYGKAKGQVGFDVNLKDYGNRPYCGRGSGKDDLGIKRWYAVGQVYAGLGVELGVDLVFAKLKLAEGNAAVLLQVGLPNPTWVRGLLHLDANLLGFIKLSTTPDISLGDVCPEIASSQSCNQ